MSPTICLKKKLMYGGILSNGLVEQVFWTFGNDDKSLLKKN